MGLKDWIANSKPVSRKEYDKMRADHAELQQLFLEAQVVLAGIEDVQVSGETGNPYVDYDRAIEALSKKYEGIAKWGNQSARNIVDVRSAFIIGNGIQVVEQDPVTKKKQRGTSESQFRNELDFIEEFIQHNDLDEEAAQDMAKEAELEGRVLFRLSVNQEAQQIDLRHISYSTHKYKVSANKDDYKKFEQVEYKLASGNQVIIKDANEFIYKKFAGRTNKVNDIMPKVATVLRQIEDLDKALVDLRKINRLFASPTPYFKTEDATEAKALYDKMREINWKIGKLLVGAAEFSLVSADVKGVESLIKEVTALVKIISGATGIPVHFLGLPDLMSNRAVSTDLFEMIMASTNRERKTWVGTYEEVFKKALAMANSGLGKSFNTDVVSCDIPQVTAAKLKELSEVWLPLFMNNVVDLDYMLSMIPDADPERIKQSNEEAMIRQIELMQEQSNNEPDDDEEDTDE